MFLNACRCTTLFVVLLSSEEGFATTSGGLVEYSGDALPDNSNPPFQFASQASGTMSVTNGILTIDNTSSAGSLDYFRTDQLLIDDLGVFQFRARLAAVGTTTALPSGVVEVRWVGDAPGQFLFFVANGFVELRAGSGATFDTNIPFDTSAFHTYSIAKLRSDNIELFIDGNLKLTKPVSEFRLTDLGPMTTGAFEQFQGNPKSRTEWDFFRYAIGDDALNLIPVPEPAAFSQLVLVAILSLRARRRKSGPHNRI